MAAIPEPPDPRPPVSSSNRPSDSPEDLYRHLVEAAPLAMQFWRLEADGRLILAGANPAADQSLGIAHQPLIGRPFPETGLEADALYDLYRRVASGETGPQPFTHAHPGPLGHRQFEGRVFRVGPGQIGVTFLDVTETHQMVDRLRTSESFLDSIIEQSPYPMWISDERGTLLRLNESLRRILHVQDDEVVGRYNLFEDTIVQERGLIPLVRQVFEEGKAVHFEIDYDTNRLRNVTLGETTRIYLDVAIFPIRDDQGRITNAVIQHKDITERKRVEDALNRRIIALTQPLEGGEVALTDLFNVKDLQQIQDAFADATGVASIITLPDGTPITQPSNFCDLCSQIIRQTERGLKNCMCSDAVIGRHQTEGPVISLCLSGGLWDAGASITAGGRHIANWLIGQVKNAEVDEGRMLAYAREIGADEAAYREALGRVQVMPAAQFKRIAEFLFLIASELSLKAYQNIQQARFITERNQAEAQLRVKEEQLRHAQRLEAVGQLAGGVAHDFNNLLAVITGYAEVSLDKVRGQEPVEKNLGQILKAAERAAWLTRQLLAFSRKQVLELKVFNLNQSIELTSGLLRRLIGEHIEFVTSLSPDLGNVRMDLGQMELVLMNLVVNARDAMPEGGTLTLGTRNVTIDPAAPGAPRGLAPGDYILLTVGDTGVGMNPQVSAKIFEPFFSTKPPEKGTGLGLATVHGIVVQNQGAITVETALGQGSVFSIFLPRIFQAADSELPRFDAPAPRAAGETILVVEDEEPIRRFVATVLENAGYRVLAAANGPEALRLSGAHPEPIHLLLTDVIMPQLSGAELANQITAARPGIRIVFTSGFTEDTVVQHGVAKSHAWFLAKPYPKLALLQKVREALDA